MLFSTITWQSFLFADNQSNFDFFYLISMVYQLIFY